MSKNQNQIFISRNKLKEEIVIVNMQTCQKLIVKDKIMLEKTDEELEKFYKNFGVVSQNNRF